jgi:hypothetical protein
MCFTSPISFVMEEDIVFFQARTKFLYIIFRRLVGGVFQRSPGLSPGAVYVRFTVIKICNGTSFSSRTLLFCSVSFHRCSTLIFILKLLLSEREGGGGGNRDL